MIQLQDMMSDLIRFPDIKKNLIGAKYTGGMPMIYRFTGVEVEHPIHLENTKYKLSIETGPDEIMRKSGSLDMIQYPEEIAYAETGYPSGGKFVNDQLFGLLISKGGTSCDDNGYYNNLDAYMCTLGEGWQPTPEQWYDIANRYLAPAYVPDSCVNVCLMEAMNKYQRIFMKRGYEISLIHNLVRSGAVPLFWFAVDTEFVTFYMAVNENAVERMFR